MISQEDMHYSVASLLSSRHFSPLFTKVRRHKGTQGIPTPIVPSRCTPAHMIQYASNIH